MSIYRRGVETGAFVANHNWSSSSQRRSAAIHRWCVFFPKMILAQFASRRFWGWCFLQAILLFVVWLHLKRGYTG